MNYFTLGPEGWACQHPDHVLPTPTYWCPHLGDFIIEGQDADQLTPKLRTTVPVFPVAGIFAQVKIGDEIFPGGAAPIEMRHTPDMGREKVIPLGLWNPGEGMASIRSVILDYLRSQLDPRESFTGGTLYAKCPQRSHPTNYTSELRKKCMMENDVNFRQALLWNIVMEGACTLCIADSADPSGTFGLDPDDLRTGRNPF